MNDSVAQTRRLDPQLWLDRHGDALFRYALLHVHERSSAEDLVQDTLLAALRASARFSGQSTERTWLVGILKHKIIDHLRSRRAGADDPATAESRAHPSEDVFDTRGKWRVEPADWGRDPSRLLEASELREALWHCLGGLPKTMRVPLVLRELDGLPTDEVCKLLGLTSTNLWTVLHRARTRLRQCLERHWSATSAGGSNKQP